MSLVWWDPFDAMVPLSDHFMGKMTRTYILLLISHKSFTRACSHLKNDSHIIVREL